MRVDISDIQVAHVDQLRELAIRALDDAAAQLTDDREAERWTILDNVDDAERFTHGHHHLVTECFIQLVWSNAFGLWPGWLKVDQGQVAVIPPGVVHAERMPVGGANLIMKIIDRRLCYHLQSRPGRPAAQHVLADVVPHVHFRSTPDLLEDIAQRRSDSICSVMC